MTQLICTLGHRWEAATQAGSLAETLCPVCGLTARPSGDTDHDMLATAPLQVPTPGVAAATVEGGTEENSRADPAADALTLGLPASPPGYEIIGLLGHGAMGVVFKAKQRALDRIVALKMIRAGAHASPEVLERFCAEAAAVARLSHPSIVQIHEIGTHNGLPYFSLEYVEGGSLQRKLAGEPQPARESAALVRQLADAMQAAHDAGVVHRDLKPANILLGHQPRDLITSRPGRRSGDGRWPVDVKISDFGLAKRQDVDSLQTQAGQVLGTPSYMAPEQAAGRVADVGPLSDIYALGAILYEMLTGRPPFKAASLRDTLEQVCTQEPVPPGRLQQRLPLDLETICLKCLQKDPRRRYASARELSDDLGRFLDGEPIHARPVSRLEKCWRWCRRNPVLTGLAAAFLLLLIASLVAVTSLWLRAEANYDGMQQAYRQADEHRRDADAQRSEALKNLQTARQQRALAQERFLQAKRAVDRYFTAISETKLLRSPTMAPLRRELLREALAYYHEFVNQKSDDPLVRAEYAITHVRMGQILVEMAQWSEAVAALERGVVLFEELVREQAPLDQCPSVAAGVWNSRARHDVGEIPGGAGMVALAVKGATVLFRMKVVLEALAQRFPDVPGFAHDAAGIDFFLGGIYLWMHWEGEAVRCLVRARDRWQELGAKHPESAQYRESLALARTQLAMAHDQKKEHPEAEKLYREVLDSQPPTDVLAFVQMKLADVLHLTRRQAEAEKFYALALVIGEKTVAEEPDAIYYHMLHASCWRARGANLFQLQKYAEAEACYRKGLEVTDRLQLKAPQRQGVRGVAAEIRCWLSNLHLHHGRTAEALAEVDLALALVPQAQRIRGVRTVVLGRMKDHIRAAAEATLILAARPEDGEALYLAARGLALAAQAAREEPSESAARLADGHADRAMDALRRASKKGINVLELAPACPDFAPLRNRADYQQLVKEVEKGAKK